MAKQASVSEVRAWAKKQGHELGDRGRLPAEVWAAWESRPSDRAVPQPRAEAPVEREVPDEELAAAQSAIHQLQQQLHELKSRVAALESRSNEPRRLFARNK